MKKLFKTLFGNCDTLYPEIEGYTSKGNKKKTFSIAFAYIFYKILKKEEPSNPTLANFWTDYKNEIDIESFDQATAFRNDLLKKIRGGEFEYDFLILKEWENLIKDKNNSLLERINKKIEVKDKVYIELIKLFNKEDICYCDFVEKFTQVNTKDPSSILPDIENLLDIDFDLIRQFLNQNNITGIVYKNKSVTEKDLISQSLLKPVQNQDISALELIKEFWQPLQVSNSDNYDFKGNYKEDFETVINHSKKNLFILKGKEGSGKSFLSLYLSMGALENKFLAKFILVEEESSPELIKQEINNFLNDFPDKKYFIVIDSISNLDINTKSTQKKKYIRDFIEEIINIVSENNNIYILLTLNENRSMYKDLFDKNIISEFQEFNIKDINTEPKWIKTIMEKVIFENESKQINSTLKLYYSYLIEMIRKNSLKLERNELNRLLGDIAYKSLFHAPILNDFVSKFNLNNKDIDFLSDNPICRTDKHTMESIIFNHEIFKYILAGEFILNNTDCIKRLWKANKFKSDKWRVLFIFFSERLNASNIDIFIQNPLLVRGIIFHLRRLRKLEDAEKFLQYIKDEEIQNNERNYLILESSKRFYVRYGDYISCLNELSKIINSENEKELYYEYIIQASSCTLDLFLPVTTIKIINQYIENNKIEKDSRIYGNLSRAYLRTGNYEKAEEYLNKKLEIHIKDNSLDEATRDKTDLILIKAFQFSENKIMSTYKESLKLFNEIIEYYNKTEEKEEVISYLGKKIYVYRNLSYFLPYLNNTNSQELIDLFLNLNDTIEEKAPLGIIYTNLSIYYYKIGDLTKSLSYILKALKYLETYEVELLFVNYFHFIITGEKDSQEKALGHYHNFMKNVDFTSDWVLKNISDDLKENVLLKFEDLKNENLTLTSFKIF